MFGKKLKPTKVIVTQDDLAVPDVVETKSGRFTPYGITADYLFNPTQIKITGESFRQDVLEQIAQMTKGKTFGIWLMPEPTNKHDEKAVKVMVGRHLIGYLPKAQARKWSKTVLGLWAEREFLQGEAWGLGSDAEGVGQRKVWGAKVFYEPHI